MADSFFPDAPSDEIFDEVKRAAIELWKTYDDTFKYATQKVDRIKDVENYSDNFAYIIGMFDPENQRKLMMLVSKEAQREILRVIHWTIDQQ